VNTTHRVYRHNVFFLSAGMSHNLLLWDVNMPPIPSVPSVPVDFEGDSSTVTLVGVSALEMWPRFLIDDFVQGTGPYFRLKRARNRRRMRISC